MLGLLARRARPGAASVKVFVDTAPVMEKPLAQARRPRLAGQAHQSRLARVRLLAVSRLDLHQPRARARRAGSGSLRRLPRLSRRLPDAGLSGALSSRCAPLHFLSDDRAQGPYRRRVPRRDRQSHLWLRRLPCRLSVEQIRAGLGREAKAAAPAPISSRRRSPISPALDEAAFRAHFAGSPIKRIGHDALPAQSPHRHRQFRRCAAAPGGRGQARPSLAAGACHGGLGRRAIVRCWRNTGRSPSDSKNANAMPRCGPSGRRWCRRIKPRGPTG